MTRIVEKVYVSAACSDRTSEIHKLNVFGKEFFFAYPADFDPIICVYRSGGVVWVSGHEPCIYSNEVQAGDEAVDIGEMDGPAEIGEIPDGSL